MQVFIGKIIKPSDPQSILELLEQSNLCFLQDKGVKLKKRISWMH